MQTIAGVDDCERSFTSKSENEKVVFYDSLRYTIAGSMSGVSVENIKNLTAYCITRRLDAVSVSFLRRLATALSSSIYVSYFVEVRNPETNYQKLSQQLQDSVDSGYFAELLMNVSYSYNISAFDDVTSYDITVEDVTVYPSSSLTTNPSSSPTTNPRHDSTEAIFISILVLVSCVIVVVIISVVIVILRITAVVIHPTVAAGEIGGGGGGGEYVADDKI
jgi:hypothetical protein